MPSSVAEPPSPGKAFSAAERRAARDYGKHWLFRLFSAFPPPHPRHPIRIPPAFQCPRSGFHGFQCRHPSRIPPALLPSSFVLFVSFVAENLPFPGRENFYQSLENDQKIFPIIGKNGLIFPTIGKLFSNHWKTGLLPRSQRIVQGGGCVSPGRREGCLH